MTDHRYDLVVTNEMPPVNWSGTTGVSSIPRYADLEKHPTALNERESLHAARDHVHLAVFEGADGKLTDLVQWWGRASDGRHYPHGRIMKIVAASAGGHPHG